MSTDRCIAKLNKSARHALSMIESGQITNTRRTAPCFIRKSAAQIALAVLPVPCSLKQNDVCSCHRKAAVVVWCSKGCMCPVQSYRPSIGEGAFMFRLFSVWVSLIPHLTATLLSGSCLLFGITVVTCAGFLRRNNSALLSYISTLFSIATPLLLVTRFLLVSH